MDPVLFIGLGGTGKQTLMHLRRLFMDNYAADMPKALLDRYGPGRLPHTAFLCFDADTQMTDLDGKPVDDLLRAAEMRKDSEFFSVELGVEETKDLYRHPERYPAYQPWYDFGLEKFGVPRDGCGQTRPWGRLAFFQHYDKIRSVVSRALGPAGLLSVETRNDARDAGVDLPAAAPIQVFVVFSVAGGTGSGMFLDMAFLLRDLEAEIGRAIKTEAIVLLPGAFSRSPEAKIFANAYAALLELEHYSLQRDVGVDSGPRGFPIYWPGAYDPQRGPRRLEPPAFGATWLISERSRGATGLGAAGLDPSRKGELIGMIAEWLFLRSSPRHATLGEAINGDASNYLANQMAETAALPIYEAQGQPTGVLELSKRYGSFGLSKIYLPKTVLHQISANRLVSDLVVRWKEKTTLPASASDTIAREVYPDVLLRIASATGADREGVDALFEFLDRGDGATSIIEEGARAFHETFDPVVLAEDFERDLAVKTSARFGEWSGRHISDDEMTEEKKGDLARQIRRRTEVAMRRIRDGLNRRLSDAMKTAGRRAPFAGEILNSVLAAYADVERAAETLRADRADEAQESRQFSEQVLRHARGEKSPFVLKTIATVAVEDQAQAVEAELERQIYAAIKTIAAYAVKLISEGDELGATEFARSSLRHQLSSLERNLEAVTGKLAERIQALRGRSTSVLNAQVISTNDSGYYVARDGSPLTERGLSEIEMRLYSDQPVFGGAPGSPWTLRDGFQGAAFAQTVARLVEFGVREMAHVPGLANDALAAFGSNYSSHGGNAEFIAALRPLVDYGAAWLPITHSSGAGWGRHSQVAEIYRVARASRGGPEDLRFSEAMSGPNAPFGGLAANVRELGPELGDAAYFTQEIAGFPLSELPGIKDYRDRAYIPYMTNQAGGGDGASGGSSALHLEADAARYGALFQPTKEEAIARSGALEVFIEALMKGLVRPKFDPSGFITYSRNTTVGFRVVEEDLGRYERVILMLSAPESRARRDLERAVQEVEDQWTRLADGGALTKARLLALLSYYRFDDRRPIRLPEWDTAVERVINRLTDRYGQALVQEAAQESATLDRITTETPPTSRFRVLGAV